MPSLQEGLVFAVHAERKGIMRVKVFIRWVVPKIGKMRIDVPAQLKQCTPDPKKLRHAVWSCAGDLSKEIVLKTVPGSRWLWRSLQGCVHKIQSIGFSSAKLKETGDRVSKLDSENSSLKEMRKRISLLERENLSLRKQKTNWQHRCITLMASMFALATGAEMKSWKTRALLLTISDRLLPSDQALSDDVLIITQAKTEDCIQP